MPPPPTGIRDYRRNQKKNTTTNRPMHPAEQRQNAAAHRDGFKQIGNQANTLFQNKKKIENISSEEEPNSSLESVNSQHSAHSNMGRLERNEIKSMLRYNKMN